MAREALTERLESMLTTVQEMAGGDLSRRLPISAERDACDAIAFAINILADEVQFRYDSDARKAAELASTLEKLEATIAELHRTQAQLVQSAKMVALGEFSSGIAHEINNPLALIRIHVDQLQNLVRAKGHPLGAQILDGLKKVDVNVERMARTTKHVQDFSRSTKSAKLPIPLNRVVAAALELTSEQLRIKKIALDVKLTTTDPLVEANFNDLEHVLLNLLSNASDSIVSDRLEAKIVIETDVKDHDAVISVIDNGVGIEADLVDKIFEPFFTTKDPGRGTGLGLSISYRIVKDHGGTISCASTVGEGSRFEIRLPRVESQLERQT
ncbi:MAG: ATP-binding protein [Bdellovibrionota bacterium]